MTTGYTEGQLRLQELATICATRKLTADELAEAFDLSVGAETVAEVEAFLADSTEGGERRA